MHGALTVIGSRGPALNTDEGRRGWPTGYADPSTTRDAGITWAATGLARGRPALAAKPGTGTYGRQI